MRKGSGDFLLGFFVGFGFGAIAGAKFILQIIGGG